MIAAEVTQKMESLSKDDYEMIVQLIERLADKPSNVLKEAREKYMNRNPMSMEEIDQEIQEYRKGKRV